MAESDQTDRWTISRLLSWTRDWLARHGVDDARLSAELLLSHALGCEKIELYTRFDQEPSEDERARFRDLVRRAAEHAPVAYLIGKKEFFSLEFEVTPAVLIPRPETEAVVQRVIDFCKAQGRPVWHVLDVGTGSGCIVIAIAHLLPSARLVATDVSADAIEIARRNAARHAVADRITFAVADTFALSDDLVPAGGFDIIATNPPYIPEADLDQLPETVRRYEPTMALTVPGSDGLVFYRRLATESNGILAQDGSIICEIGAGQHGPVEAIFAEAGRFEHLGTFRDPTDPHQRVVHVRRT